MYTLPPFLPFHRPLYSLVHFTVRSSLATHPSQSLRPRFDRPRDILSTVLFEGIGSKHVGDDEEQELEVKLAWK